MKKSKTYCLPTIPKSPYNAVCKTYLYILMYTIEVLELRYILVHGEMNGCVRQDFRSKMEAQRSLFKNSSIMGCFHQMRVFQRVLFKRYNCVDLQDWLVDS